MSVLSKIHNTQLVKIQPKDWSGPAPELNPASSLTGCAPEESDEEKPQVRFSERGHSNSITIVGGGQ